MFDFVHENKRVVQIVLLLIVLPFAFWGVSSYRQSGADALATVEGESVSQQDFDNAIHQQQERMQQLTHGSFDAAMFDSPEVKKSILDSLINQKLLAVRARAVGFTLSDEQLAQIIAGEQAFQQDGKFDRQQYEAVLRKQNMSPPMFESRVKEQLALRQLAELYSQNGYASDSAVDRLIRINEEQRVVSVAQIALEPFLKQVKIDDAAIKSYYDGNQPEFKTPERARVEYVVFSADALMSQMTADANEIKEYYDKHQAEFGTPEQRHAAHILIAVSAQASDADKKAAKAKADSILQQVKQTPAKFAELAKQFSADPGSAANGGDLGFFGRGMMVKSFDDAAFSLKPGEISSVVQTQYGFHIIKLLEVKAANIPPLAEMKTAITQKIKLLKAGDKFAELADKFSSTAYEQSDSLKPAAMLAKMPVQQSGWLEKGQPGAAPWTDRALQAVFSDDVVKHKRNSSAVEIAPDTLLAVRLLEYKKADTRPLAEVSGAIRQKLLRQQAGELASKHGQAALAMLQRGEKPALKWTAAKTISRAQHGDMDAELARRAIQADVGKLPAYVGAESAQGYMLARVDTIKEFGPIDEAKRARYLQQLRQLSGEELLQAYIAEAKKHASVSVKSFVVDKKG